MEDAGKLDSVVGDRKFDRIGDGKIDRGRIGEEVERGGGGCW